jgi:hypothetical protein
VTWGNQSKDFDGQQLAKGINLAAEFLDNPFGEPFRKVHEAVQRQQNHETPMIKTWVHGLPQFKKDLPEDAECFDRIIDHLGTKDKALSESAAAAIVPVKHTIKIEKAQ